MQIADVTIGATDKQGKGRHVCLFVCCKFLTFILLAAHGTCTCIHVCVRRYSRDHACTIALTLATHVRAQKPSWTTSKSLSSPGKDTNARHPSLESWSTSALFRYSGEPGLSDRGTVSLSHVHEPLGRLVPKSEIQYSGKHNGILMYFIRAMRRLWKIPLHYMTNAKLKLMIGTLIQNAQDELYPLLAFMESHAAALMGSSDRYTIKEAQMKENANLTALQQMIRYVIESLSLVSMLMDHPMEELLKKYM